MGAIYPLGQVEGPKEKGPINTQFGLGTPHRFFLILEA